MSKTQTVKCAADGVVVKTIVDKKVTLNIVEQHRAATGHQDFIDA